jgi:hypothetical protein
MGHTSETSGLMNWKGTRKKGRAREEIRKKRPSVPLYVLAGKRSRGLKIIPACGVNNMTMT